MEIVPAIIGKNIKEIAEKVEQVSGATKWVQIDVMDGVFAPTKSWPYTEGDISELSQIDAIRKDELKIEIHLMVKDPEKVVAKYVEHGADRIVFHFEATEKYVEMIKFLEAEEVEVAVSFLLDTPSCKVDEFIGDVDGVQFMSIKEIGSYGQDFEEKVFEKIMETKEKYPGLPLSVDGGVNLKNGKRLLESGVEDLVVGSAIFRADDPKAEILKFKSLSPEE
jgi:ribulose-phosphate 3-epimerase